MNYQKFTDIYTSELAEGAIINDRMEGFREDYLLLHCLLRKHKIKTCFEIGTHTGFGTKIIKNALGENSMVYSLDLSDDLAHLSKQHPLSDGKQGVGIECDVPYLQLLGNSLTFPYECYPAQAYYIDGEHDEQHVTTETANILNQVRPQLVIYHDADMTGVFKGILEGLHKYHIKSVDKWYQSYRVIDTRIAYLLKEQ